MGRGTGRPKALVVFGTRPEAIKLAPLVRALSEVMEVRTCATAQHREMLDKVTRPFGIAPDHDLDLMRKGEELAGITAAILQAVGPVIGLEAPDVVVVQGDTTTTFAAALSAFYLGVPVAHVEAGLRTHDISQPFPEEMNRRLTAQLATWQFAPTPLARENLLAEGVGADRIHVVGNTGIDALLDAVRQLEGGPAVPAAWPAGVEAAVRSGRRIVLVTGHRRESFGPGFRRICEALRSIAERNEDVTVVYPVHLNPNVQRPVREILSSSSRVLLTEPLDYLPFVALMRNAELILTDSGGIQEEAPSLGKPVLLLREKSDRPEGLLCGVARLVGTDVDRIVAETETLLGDRDAYAAMAHRENPYGDGHAAPRIAGILARVLAPRAEREPAGESVA